MRPITEIILLIHGNHMNNNPTHNLLFVLIFKILWEVIDIFVVRITYSVASMSDIMIFFPFFVENGADIRPEMQVLQIEIAGIVNFNIDFIASNRLEL